MGEKNDGLGLGLGLGCGANQYSSSSFHLNLMQNPSEAKHNHRQHRIFGILYHSRSKRDLVSVIPARNRREPGAAGGGFRRRKRGFFSKQHGVELEREAKRERDDWRRERGGEEFVLSRRKRRR